MNNKEKNMNNLWRIFLSGLIAVLIFGLAFPIMSQAKTPDNFQYIEDIPMPEKHQKYLYELVKERGLDYEETLATIKHESSFDASVVASKNYGYFQINKVNHAYLSKTLDTANKPLDPYVNINWGTYMLANLYEKYEKKGLKGKELKEAVLSAYNKGEGGYKKTGKATKYIKKHDQALDDIEELMEQANKEKKKS